MEVMFPIFDTVLPLSLAAALFADRVSTLVRGMEKNISCCSGVLSVPPALTSSSAHLTSPCATPTLPYPTLPYLTLPYATMPCPTLPCPTLPSHGTT